MEDRQTYTVKPGEEIDIECGNPRATRVEAYLAKNLLSCLVRGFPWDMPDLVIVRFSGRLRAWGQNRKGTGAAKKTKTAKEAAAKETGPDNDSPVHECFRLTRNLWRLVTEKALAAEDRWRAGEMPYAAYQELAERFLAVEVMIGLGGVEMVIEMET